VFSPPNYIPPKPPITENERAAFTGFLSRFDQVYSSILPGEIVRECLSNIQAGLIEPAKLTGIKQLIVDEYQDLNPIDLEFIDLLKMKQSSWSLVTMIKAFIRLDSPYLVAFKSS
jgi:hypothetical protein